MKRRAGSSAVVMIAALLAAASVGTAFLVTISSCNNELLARLQEKIDRDRENAFTGYRFTRTENPGLQIDTEAEIAEGALTVLVPVNSDVTALVAEFDIHGKEAVIGETVQESGVTPNDFTEPVLYAIRSLDGTSKEYEVTVREASDNADLSSIIVERGTEGGYEPFLEPEFDTAATDYIFWVPHTVSFVNVNADTVDPNAAAAVSAASLDDAVTVAADTPAEVSLVDGPNGINITVTAEDGLVTRTYTVEVYRAIGIPQTHTPYTAHAYDDGSLQMGIQWDQATRFENQGDGTVLDTLTGLIWTEYPYQNQVNGYTWDVALDIVQDYKNNIEIQSGEFLTDGSERGDWRLPNINEMFSLFCAEDADPGVWLDLHEFEEYQNTSRPFWTSTTPFGNSAHAFFWGSDTGGTGTKSKSSGNPFYNFTAVRGPVGQGVIGIPKSGQTETYRFGKDDDDGHFEYGVPFPDPRYIDNDDGTILDRLTGFLWLKDWDILPGGSSWNGALGDVAALEDIGTSLSDGSENGDWRLPNIREYMSITNFGYADLYMWLDPNGFQNIPISPNLTVFWSSTHRGNIATDDVYRFDVSTQSFSSVTKGVSLRTTAVRNIE